MSNRLVDKFTDSITGYVDVNSEHYAQPQTGVIIDVSDNFNFCSVKLDTGELSQVPCFGLPKIGTEVVLIFIGGSYNNPLAICNPLNTTDSSLIDEYNTRECYNWHSNGDFSNGSTGYTGNFVVTDEESFTDIQGKSACILPGNSISFTETLTGLMDSDEFWKLQLCYKGVGEITLQVKNVTSNKLMLTRPTPGYDKVIWKPAGLDWNVNRLIYPFANKVQVTISNNSKYPEYVDGILLYKEDVDMSYYPSEEDVLNGR